MSKQVMNMDFAATERRVVGSLFEGLWMTSVEIADKMEKDHKNVMRDIKLLIDRGSINALNFELIEVMVKVGFGYRPSPAYKLDFFATMLLVTGYDPARRGLIIDRWMELENERVRPAAKPQFKIPQTMAEALRLAADQAETIEKQDAQIIHLEKTKAHISEKREITAMVTASVAVRKVKKLEEQLGINGDYLAAKAIDWIEDYFKVRKPGTWTVIGQQLRTIAISLGEPMMRVDDPRWPKGVNTYTKKTVDVFKKYLDNDWKYCYGYRKVQ